MGDLARDAAEWSKALDFNLQKLRQAGCVQGSDCTQEGLCW